MDQAPRQVHSGDLLILANMAEMVVRHLEQDKLLDLQKLVRCSPCRTFVSWGAAGEQLGVRAVSTGPRARCLTCWLPGTGPGQFVVQMHGASTGVGQQPASAQREVSCPKQALHCGWLGAWLSSASMVSGAEASAAASRPLFWALHTLDEWQAL